MQIVQNIRQTNTSHSPAKKKESNTTKQRQFIHQTPHTLRPIGKIKQTTKQRQTNTFFSHSPAKGKKSFSVTQIEFGGKNNLDGNMKASYNIL